MSVHFISPYLLLLLVVGVSGSLADARSNYDASLALFCKVQFPAVTQRADALARLSLQILGSFGESLPTISFGAAFVHASIPAPVTITLQRFLASTLFQLLDRELQPWFLPAATSLQNFLLKVVGGNLRHSPWVRVALLVVTQACTLSALRANFMAGRRGRERAHTASKCFPAAVIRALSRKGAANDFQASSLIRFFVLQALVVLPRQGADLHAIYQFGLWGAYIGRGQLVRQAGQSGMLGRFLEHVKLFWRVSSGKRALKEHIRYAKLVTLNLRFLFFMVLSLVQAKHASAAETAYINYSLPQCNDWSRKSVARLEGSKRRSRTGAGARGRRKKERIYPCAPPEGEAGFHESLLAKAVSKAVSKEHWMQKVKDCQGVLRKPLLGVYDHFLRLRTSAGLGEGPVHLYGKGCLLLLLKFAGVRPFSVNWDQALSSRSLPRDWLYSVWLACRILPSHHEKLQAQASLESFFSRRSMPVPRPYLIRVPHPLVIRHLSRWMRKVVATYACAHPFWSFLVKSFTKFLVCPVPPLKRATSMQGEVKRFCLSSLGSLDSDTIARAMRGEDLFRIPLHGRLPAPLIEGRSPSQFSQVSGWLGFFCLPRFFLSSFEEISLDAHLQGVGCQHPASRLSSLQNSAVELVCEARRSKALVTEDKDPAVLWACDPYAMILRWLFFLGRSSGRWSFSFAPKGSVLAWYRLAIDFTLPKSLCRRRTAISWDHLPYAFPTLKLRCWDPSPAPPGEGRHRCNKLAHSCLRNIISFVGFPNRGLYRKFSRAFSYICGWFFAGWRFSSLDLALDELRSRVRCLRPPQFSRQQACYVCRRCGSSMATPGLVVADAGQAYESISSAAISSFLLRVEKNCKETPKLKTVFVMHGQKAACGPGGSVKRKYSDRTVFWARSVLRCVYGFLGMKLYRLGDFWLRQLRGIPIGGPLSFAILDGLLCSIEHDFDRSSANRARDFAAGRYCDDLILASYSVCTACLKKQMYRVFASLIEFEVDNSVVYDSAAGCVFARYLDANLCFQFCSFTTAPFHKNEMFALTGSLEMCGKHSLEPFSGKINLQRQRAELKGRLHRWSKIGGSKPVMFYTYVIDMLFFLRMGFGKDDLKKLWRNISPDPVLSELAKISLAFVFLIGKVTLSINDQELAVETFIADFSAYLGSEEVGVVQPDLLLPLGVFGFAMGKAGGQKGGDSWNSSPWGGSGGNWFGQGGGNWPGGGGKGNWSGKGGGSAGGAANPFRSMTNQFNQLIESVSTMGEMARIGQAMNGQHRGAQQAPQHSAGQPVGDFASVLANALSAASPAEPPQQVAAASPQKSQITQIVSKLHELASADAPVGSATVSLDAGGGVESSPAFKKLKAQVDGIGKTVEAQGSKLTALEATANSTDNNVKAILDMMKEGGKGQGSQGRRRSPPYTPPPRGGSSGRRSPSTGRYRSPSPPPSERAGGLEPLFSSQVDEEVHRAFLRLTSVRSDRASRVVGEIEENDGALPFRLWWDRVSPLKSCGQWVLKA